MNKTLSGYRSLAFAIFFAGASLAAVFVFQGKTGLVTERSVAIRPTTASHGNIIISAADAAENSSFAAQPQIEPITATSSQIIIPSSYNLSLGSLKDQE